MDVAGSGSSMHDGPGRTGPGAGHQDCAGHVRLDRFCTAHAGRQGWHLQEERLGCGDQDDSAEGPPPGPGLQVHPVRRHHGRNTCRLERQRRAHRADLPDGQILRRRRHCGARRHQGLCRPQGQDHRRGCARHRPVLWPGLDVEQERHEPQGREDHHAVAPGRSTSLCGGPERRCHDVRALPVHRARQPCGRQNFGHHARLPHGDGHRGLRPHLAQGQRQGRAGPGQFVLPGDRHDQGRPHQVQRDHGRRRQADG